MNHITLKHLRWVSLTEGISYLLLVCIGMPLKYGLDIFVVNKILGMIHGVLTVVFVGVLMQVWRQKELSAQLSLGVFIASLLPFGAFVADRKLRQLV
jgi:integral membrane protein